MTPLSQRDGRWASVALGTSKTTTIGSHGCTITCIAMAAGTTPDVINQRLKEVSGYANTNLVIWQKLKEALGVLEFEWRGYSYDNDRVSEAIKKNGFCLVEVDAARIGAPTHWVLYIGNQQMIDPWTGVIKTTSYYPPKGYAIINKIGDYMSPIGDELKELQDKYNKLEEEFKAEQQRVVDCRNDRTDLLTQIDRMRSEFDKERDDYNLRIQTAESKAKAEKELRMEQIRFLSDQLQTTQNWPDIESAVGKLIGVEDLLNKARKTEAETAEKLRMSNVSIQELKTEIERLQKELKQAKGLKDATLRELLVETYERILNRLQSVVRRNQ